MNNKKGLSTIVTTLILILLVLVAIGIIWVVVRGILEKGSQQIDVSSKCPLIDIRVVSNGTCEGTSCTFTVSRSSDGEEKGVLYRISAYDGIETGTYNGPEIGPLITSTQTGILDTNLTVPVQTITVTPFFKVNGETKLCSNSNIYKAA